MILQPYLGISPSAALYYSPIAINSGQVPSTQTDFPVLVSVTDARFKTVANGGHVQNSSGFDIRPYSDGPPTTAITGYELERYNATTGEVVMWVKVASLSSSTTPIYLRYGDSSLTTNGSSTTTWSNSFLGVYHFSDGTTLSVADGLNTHNAGNHGATAATGKVDGGAGFVSASSQYVGLTDNATGLAAVAMTYSAWVNATSFPNAYNTVVLRNITNTNYSGISVKSTGKIACFIGTTGTDRSYDGTGSNTLSSATWYYLTLTYSNAGGLIGYVNASSDGTHAGGAALSTVTGDTLVGKDFVNAGRFWNGTIDEVRLSDVVRTANWITTEYNNQVAPGTFATLGTEVAI